MQLKGLKKKDKKQVKALLSNLDFLGVRDFLVNKELYEQHNRSELLLETLLFGDYKSAAELVDEYNSSEFEREIIALFGDDYVFSRALNFLENFRAQELSLCFLERAAQAYMPEEKMYEVVKFHAFNEEFLEKLCNSNNGTLFEIFIDKCVHWQFESIYVWAVDYVADYLIKWKIFTLLKILIEKTSLNESQVNKMNDDQFAWYVGKYPIKNRTLNMLVLNNRESKFKALIRSQELNVAQLELCLFHPERFHFFTIYADEKRLPEELERKLFRKEMYNYRTAYLMRHKIGFWKRLEYFWNER